MRRRFLYPILALLALTSAAVALSACGSSSSEGGPAEGGTTEINSTWLYTGPLEDGGWNKQQRVAMDATSEMPGVTVKSIDNVPYSQQATQLINQSIAGGSNLISETLGLGTLMSTACQQSPDVYCFGHGDPAPQPPNVVSYWVEDWNFGYVAGVAAGLTTETGTIGFVAASKIPTIMQAINSYTLGCRSVLPDCQVRVVFLNSYYDPPANAQATRSLINAGADVLRTFVDDPSACGVVEKAGVWIIGQFEDYKPRCPNATITSTMWTLTDFWE